MISNNQFTDTHRCISNREGALKWTNSHQNIHVWNYKFQFQLSEQFQQLAMLSMSNNLRLAIIESFKINKSFRSLRTSRVVSDMKPSSKFPSGPITAQSARQWDAFGATIIPNDNGFGINLSTSTVLWFRTFARQSCDDSSLAKTQHKL